MRAICSIGICAPVPGELLFRVTTGHVTLLRPFLYVIDFKRALSFGEAQRPESETQLTFAAQLPAKSALP